MTTGIPGFDAITGGGLMPGSLYLIEGRAGAGKTLLCSQLAFLRAEQGDRVLFVSLIAESHGKLVRHLAPMSFFKPALLGRQVQLISAYAELRDGGPQALLGALARQIREHQPQVVVIDGFSSVAGIADPAVELPRFLHELNALVAAVRVVALLLAPASVDGMHPEHTLVDGLIELENRAHGMRRLREIEVHKIRGADHALGRHNFTISDDGIRIFPRLEGMASRRVIAPPRLPGSLASGVAGLDALVGGGIDEGSTTSLVGAPGAGKTLTGLTFLAQGLREGGHALYFGFYESPARLVDKAQRIGLPLQPALADGRMAIVWQPALEYSLDELATRLLEAIEARGAARVFVDGIDAFRDSAFYPERLARFFTALTNRLRELGATTWFSEEVALIHRQGDDGPRLDYSSVFENIVSLQPPAAGRPGKQLAIVKVRDHEFDPVARPLLIGREGVRVGSRPDAPPKRPKPRP